MLPLFSSSRPYMTSLGLLLAAFFWAAVFHLGQYALTLMSPLSAAAWRFLIAAALLLPLVSLVEGWSWQALRRHALLLGVMSAVGVLGFNVSLFYGLRQTSPVNGALIVGVCPALTAMLAALLARRGLQWAEVAGLSLGLAGVAMVVSGGSWHTLAHLQLGRGDALVMLGALCWAVYSVLPRFLHGLSPLQVSASTVGGGALLMALTAAAVSPDFPADLPARGWLAVAAMGVFGSALAYVLWNQGVRRLGASRAAVFMNFVPLFTALIGVLRGQALLWSQVGGAALVIAGVLVTSLLARPAGRSPAPVDAPAAVGRACARA